MAHTEPCTLHAGLIHAITTLVQLMAKQVCNISESVASAYGDMVIHGVHAILHDLIVHRSHADLNGLALWRFLASPAGNMPAHSITSAS